MPIFSKASDEALASIDFPLKNTEAHFQNDVPSQAASGIVNQPNSSSPTTKSSRSASDIVNVSEEVSRKAERTIAASDIANVLEEDLSIYSSCRYIDFSLGGRLQRAERILPVFLPFAGCPSRCVYCDQARQTGLGSVKPLTEILDRAEEFLLRADAQREKKQERNQGGRYEIAFYGGTFTSLPKEDRQACLSFFKRMKALGKAKCCRCSTRPDALGPEILEELSQSGIDLVELGIQSFATKALAACGRGYDAEKALAGCNAVKTAGFQLGIQLLPGMPGCDPQTFLEDVEKALALKPACLRFYPCLVLQGTVLAKWFLEKKYRPWTLEETVGTLGKALALAWEKEIPVIRLSVAPEASFEDGVLAGPRHPALGALIQGEALLQTVRKILRKSEHGIAAEGKETLSYCRPSRATEKNATNLNGKFSLLLPAFCQGFIYGNAGALKSSWQELGLPPERIIFSKMEKGRIIIHNNSYY